MKLGGQAKSLLKLAVGLCILAVVISWQPLDAYAGVWERLSLLPVALAYALSPPGMALRALQSLNLARLQGLRIGFVDLLGLQLVTAFYGLFVPGLVATGAVRWYRLAKLSGSGPVMLALIVFSRLLEIEMLLLLGMRRVLAG